MIFLINATINTETPLNVALFIIQSTHLIYCIILVKSYAVLHQTSFFSLK